MSQVLRQADDKYDRTNDQQVRQTIQRGLDDLGTTSQRKTTSRGGLSTYQGKITLANGDNNNISLDYATYIYITGPTGSFATTGFKNGEKGSLIFLRNNTAQQWTIKNESGSSSASNRIKTPSNADLILPAATNGRAAVFQYDTNLDRWVLLAYEATDLANDVTGTLAVANGGTGRATLTAHDLLVGNGTTQVSLLAPSATSGAALVSAGASADPTFGKVVLTQPATAATLTIADNKTATFNASTTFAGTDAKTLTVSNTTTLAGGDGNTLAIAANKTLTVSNSLAMAGTDSTTMTFPSTNGTIAALNIADQTLSGGANVTSNNLGTKSSGTLTIDCGTCPLQYVTNGGAFILAAPSNDGSCMLLVTNNGSAGAITFSGFTVGSATGSALDTTNAHKFTIQIWRINGTSGYTIFAHQ